MLAAVHLLKHDIYLVYIYINYVRKEQYVCTRMSHKLKKYNAARKILKSGVALTNIVYLTKPVYNTAIIGSS